MRRDTSPWLFVVFYVPADGDDAVDVIGHRLEFVHPDASIKFQQSPPGFLHHFRRRRFVTIRPSMISPNNSFLPCAQTVTK